MNAFELFPGKSLQNTIFSIVADKPGILTTELLQELTVHHGKKLTRQYVYRMVAQMIDLSLLTKTNGKLLVNHAWISKVHTYAEDVLHKLNERFQQDAAALNLADGESREFHAEALYELTKLWEYLEFGLVQGLEHYDYYQYVHHTYWVICKKFMIDTVFTMFRPQERTSLTIVGNNFFLDEYGASIYNSLGTQAKTVPDFSLGRPGYAFVVLLDYVFECTFSPRLQHNLHFFFETIQSLDQFDDELYFEVIKMKEPCTLTVTRDKQKAEQLIETISTHFS